MSENKQTAVEFLETTFLNRLVDAGIMISKYDLKLFERAKQMEREQIIEAFVAGDERGTKDIPFNAEQYYSQTYGK